MDFNFREFLVHIKLDHNKGISTNADWSRGVVYYQEKKYRNKSDNF